MTKEWIQGYADFIKDKSVIIVGPSSHILNKGLGNFIDLHDVVVRLNNSSILPRDLDKDYGSKCDVIYTASCLLRYTKTQEDKLKKVKYIFMTKFRHAPPGLKKTSIQEDIDWANKHKIFFTDMFHAHGYALNNKIWLYGAHMGTWVIHHLLSQPIKSLYVTGISFYRTDKVDVEGRGGREAWHRVNPMGVAYYANCKQAIKKIFGNANIDIVKGPSDGSYRQTHNPVLDENVFFEIYAKDDRVKFDEYLQNLAKEREKLR